MQYSSLQWAYVRNKTERNLIWTYTYCTGNGENVTWMLDALKPDVLFPIEILCNQSTNIYYSVSGNGNGNVIICIVISLTSGSWVLPVLVIKSIKLKWWSCKLWSLKWYVCTVQFLCVYCAMSRVKSAVRSVQSSSRSVQCEVCS